MKHEWKKLPSPFDSGTFQSLIDAKLINPPKSDVYVCKRCNQIWLVEIGDPKPTVQSNKGVQDLLACDDSIIKDVHDS